MADGWGRCDKCGYDEEGLYKHGGKLICWFCLRLAATNKEEPTMAAKKKIAPLQKGEVINLGCGETLTVDGVWKGTDMTTAVSRCMGGLILHVSTTRIVPKIAISGKALKAIRELLDRAEATIEP
jgi:hypothetical protein